MSDFKYRPITTVPIIYGIVTRRGWEQAEWHREVIGKHSIGPEGERYLVLGPCARDERPLIISFKDLEKNYWLIEPLPPKPRTFKVRRWHRPGTHVIVPWSELSDSDAKRQGYVLIEVEGTEVVEP